MLGGGVALSLPASHRIATESTVFAMPETGIGFFPDVGASHFFNWLPGKLGLYLAMTGTRLYGKDVLASGFATHFTDSKNLKNIERDLMRLPNANGINEVLNTYCTSLEDNKISLEKNLDQINELFTANSVENIIKNLKNDTSEFAQETLKVDKKN